MSAPHDTWQWQEPGTAWRGVGIYHVTLTIPSREPLLGELVIPDNDPKQARVDILPLGKALLDCQRHVPVPIEQVIDSLQRQETQRVVEIKGLQEHSIYSYFSLSDFPELTFSEEDLLPRPPLVASDN